MAKKHSILRFIAASALAAIFAGLTASFFRKRRERALDDYDDYDDFDEFDKFNDKVKPEDEKADLNVEEASEVYEAWDSPEENEADGDPVSSDELDEDSGPSDDADEVPDSFLNKDEEAE